MPSTTLARVPATLAEMDGLCFRQNSERLPHPVDLARWQREGLYYIDVPNCCFRLTERGRNATKACVGA